MHVVSICFKCFIRMFASVSSGCCICLQWFSNVFQSFSQVFQTFVSSVSSVFFLYVATVASGCFKSRSGVVHGMHVGSGWRRGRRSGGVGHVRGGAGPLLVRSLASMTH